MSQSWRSAPQDDRVWLDWTAGGAVYHRPSGKTHFVNAATVLLLREVLREPTDETSASRALLAAQGLSDQPEFLDHVRRLLLRLEQLGLVERVST